MRKGELNDMSLYRCCTTIKHAVQRTLTITRKRTLRAYDNDMVFLLMECDVCYLM
jgi:hypothetical protein